MKWQAALYQHTYTSMNFEMSLYEHVMMSSDQCTQRVLADKYWEPQCTKITLL